MFARMFLPAGYAERTVDADKARDCKNGKHNMHCVFVGLVVKPRNRKQQLTISIIQDFVDKLTTSPHGEGRNCPLDV